jgi:riboflavin kinase/FMN adenylyltransferase
MEYTTSLLEHEAIAITIGNFDGIHRGHVRLMQELRTQAEELHCTPVLVTFAPHTLTVVRPDITIAFLTTLEEKLELTRKYGKIEQNIVIHFTPEVVAMSAQEFMDFLLAHFAIKGLVVGANFSLGHNRMGDVTFLEAYGQQKQIAVRSIPLEEAEQARISSTRIRALVAEGAIHEAATLLGHPFRVNGMVVHGDKRGRLLGFPTANIRPEPQKLIPANGVYAVRVRLADQPESDPHHRHTVYNGVVNIGTRPTFNGKERLVEAHLLDADLDLYDTHLSIDFFERLRGEQRFSGLEELKAQITQDVQQARYLLHTLPSGE